MDQPNAQAVLDPAITLLCSIRHRFEEFMRAVEILPLSVRRRRRARPVRQLHARISVVSLARNPATLMVGGVTYTVGAIANFLKSQQKSESFFDRFTALAAIRPLRSYGFDATQAPAPSPAPAAAAGGSGFGLSLSLPRTKIHGLVHHAPSSSHSPSERISRLL